MELVELIDQAPWREAVTYRDTWPHEYVVIKKDKQEELLDAVCKRFCDGEGVDGRFFPMKNRYLFIGDYKYWLMTPCTEIDLKKDDYVLNRALIYRDRRDFLIKDGDNGRRDKVIDGIFGIDAEEKFGGTEASQDTEGVPVKQIWLNEASDFTPWLANNLPLLGEALNMELEIVQQEAASGRYYLDILADDAESSAAVVIENQLEWTNHGHLGQVLTYAGWHDAHTLIWVALHFHEEHRAALEWLNRWTTDEIEVFGVELHTTEEGDSEANVEFVPVVFPESWSRGEDSKPVQVKLQSVQLREFFQPLVNDLRDAGFTDRKKALTTRYHPFPLRASNITYYACFETDGTVWVYIPGRTANLDELRRDEYRQEIESELNILPGTRLNWRVPSSRSLGVYKNGSLFDEEKHDEIRKWMFDNLIKFNKVFNSRMERIVNELQAADGEQAEGSTDINEGMA